MDELQIDIQDRLFSLFSRDDVLVPDLFEHRLRGVGFCHDDSLRLSEAGDVGLLMDHDTL